MAEAKRNGYNYVVFPKGFYPIASEWISAILLPLPLKDDLGIVAPSGMTLDLRGATFRLLPNDRINYTLLLIFNVKNVTIIGGHFIGDRRHEHIVVVDPNREPTKTYEWGHGICIAFLQNIIVKNVKLEQLTSDGVAVSAFTYPPKDVIHNKKVLVPGSDISDCRRHGICLVSGQDVELSYNKITNINGKNPQSGINLQPSKDKLEWILNTKIHNNHITKAVNSSISTGTEKIGVYENQVDNRI